MVVHRTMHGRHQRTFVSYDAEAKVNAAFPATGRPSPRPRPISSASRTTRSSSTGRTATTWAWRSSWAGCRRPCSTCCARRRRSDGPGSSQPPPPEAFPSTATGLAAPARRVRLAAAQSSCTPIAVMSCTSSAPPAVQRHANQASGDARDGANEGDRHDVAVAAVLTDRESGLVVVPGPREDHVAAVLRGAGVVVVLDDLGRT